MPEGTDPYPYRRKRRPGQAGPRKRSRPKKKPADRERSQALTSIPWLLALVLVGFFLGRAMLLGELMPFGPALAAAVIRLRRSYGVWVTCAVGAGIVSQAGTSVLPGYLLALALIFVLQNLLPAKCPRPWLVVPGTAAAALLVVRTAFLAFSAPTTYGYLTIFFEAVFAAVLTQLFVVGLGPLMNAGSPRALTAEELFSLLTLFAGVITGAGGYTWWLVSLRGILSRFFVLLAAFLGGPGLGAAVGALAGVIPGLTFGTTQGMVDAYAFVGLIAGLCAGFGRLGVGLGFLLGNIVLSIYTVNFTSFTAALVETGVALALYLVFPESLTVTLRIFLADLLPTASRGSSPPGRAQTFLARRVHEWAGTFRALARTYEEVTATAAPGAGPTPEENRLQGVVDQTAAVVCQGCSLHQTCWEREFYRTFQNLANLVGELDNEYPGPAAEEVRRRCPRHRELGIAALSFCAASRLEHTSRWKMRQERETVAATMSALAGMLESLATRVQETSEWAGPPLPDGWREKLRKKGVQVFALTWESTGEHTGEAVADLLPCPAKANCWQAIASLLQEHLTVPFHPATQQCLYQEGEQSCRVRLFPLLRFRLSLGVAVRAREGNDVSGDSFAICPLPDGRTALILSDGMGTGTAAAQESQAATRLLVELLQADFEPEVAVRMVNATLLMQKPEESFTTIDLAIVDLYEGQAAFIKVGAPPAFVGRPGRLGVIRGESLPAGILKDIEVTTSTRALAAGDYLVLATDGVHEAHPDGGKDLWLAGLLQDIADVHPRELADLILNLASAHPARDDQAVLVARLEENG